MATAPLPFVTLRRKMISLAKKFHDYNFRHYFVRKIAEDFDSAAVKITANEEALKTFMKDQKKEFFRLRRMVIVNRMYSRVPLVIETQGAEGSSSIDCAASSATDGKGEVK